MADPDIEIDSEALSDGESSRALDGPPPTSDVALPGGGEPEHGHVSSSHEQLRDKIGPKRAKKRRRTARACDECRCKKIKCDGRQPCEHCEGYDYGKVDIAEPCARTVEMRSLSLTLSPRAVRMHIRQATPAATTVLVVAELCQGSGRSAAASGGAATSCGTQRRRGEFRAHLFYDGTAEGAR